MPTVQPLDLTGESSSSSSSPSSSSSSLPKTGQGSSPVQDISSSSSNKRLVSLNEGSNFESMLRRSTSVPSNTAPSPSSAVVAATAAMAMADKSAVVEACIAEIRRQQKEMAMLAAERSSSAAASAILGLGNSSGHPNVLGNSSSSSGGPGSGPGGTTSNRSSAGAAGGGGGAAGASAGSAAALAQAQASLLAAAAVGNNVGNNTGSSSNTPNHRRTPFTHRTTPTSAPPSSTPLLRDNSQELLERLRLIQRQERDLQKLRNLQLLEQRELELRKQQKEVAAAAAATAAAAAAKRREAKEQEDAAAAAAGSSASDRGSWFICVHCKSRAFTNREEAREHEASCPSNKGAKKFETAPNFSDALQTPIVTEPRRSVSASAFAATPVSSISNDDDRLSRLGRLSRELAEAIASRQHRHHQESSCQQESVNSMLSLGGSALKSQVLAAAASAAASANFVGQSCLGASTRSSANSRELPPPPPLTMASSNDSFRDDENEFSIALAIPEDEHCIPSFDCFVRSNCIQAFAAPPSSNSSSDDEGSDGDVSRCGLVGIRCPFCPAVARGSFYFPSSLADIYEDAMKLVQGHVVHCSSVPVHVMARYRMLRRSARPGYDSNGRRYWIESAKTLGFYDGPGGGVRLKRRNNRPLALSSRKHGISSGLSLSALMAQDSDQNRDRRTLDVLRTFSNRSSFSSMGKGDGREFFFDDSSGFRGLQNRDRLQNKERFARSCSDDFGMNDDEDASVSSVTSDGKPVPSLVLPEDAPTATSFSYYLLSQMRPSSFTDADRLGKRKGLPVGFAGLACRHCYGGYGAGRFFPSTIKTLSDTSKTLNVLHNHMTRCRKCPPKVRATLDKLREKHDEERARMKFGSQKAFFAKIWARLHGSKGGSTRLQGNAMDGGSNSAPKAMMERRSDVLAKPSSDGVTALSMAAMQIAGMKRSAPSVVDDEDNVANDASSKNHGNSTTTPVDIKSISIPSNSDANGAKPDSGASMAQSSFKRMRSV